MLPPRRYRSSPLQEVAAKKLRVMSAWLRDYITAIKNGHIHPFTAMERRAREATRNEPWGPTGKQLNDLAEASYNSTDCEIIFAVIQLRLGYPPEKWRNVYKALVLLEFVLLRGSEQCIQITQEDLVYKLEDLETFAYTSPEGKDCGVNVRMKAKAVASLLADGESLRSERATFQRKRRAYLGFTRDQMASAKPFQDDFQLPSPSTSSGGLRRTLSDSSMHEAKHAPAGHLMAPTCNLRNAGETKGVSMESNEKQLAALKQLLDEPGNRFCADCVGGGAAGRASWASINTGVFLCMRCAGVHRGLGTHVSKVRSCTLDTWLPEQVDFMASAGNARANAFYEACLGPGLKPAYGSVDLDSFIRRKYTARAFAAEGQQWPPAAGAADSHLPAEPPLPEAQQQSEAAPIQDLMSLDDTPAPPLPPRSQPRLQGRRSSRTVQQPVHKPLTGLLSVPLPPRQAEPAVAQSHSTAAPSVNLLDDNPVDTVSSAPPPTIGAGLGHEVELLSFDSPRPRQVLPDAWQVRPAAVPADASQDLTFQGESVSDWGLATPRLPRLHVPAASVGGASELGSVASTPFLTPSFSSLIGPGAAEGSVGTLQQTAPMRYMPPDVAASLQSRQPGGPSALAKATKQWSAAAQQGERGVYEDLVLHAVASMRPPGGSRLSQALVAGQAPKPPAMRPQVFT